MDSIVQKKNSQRRLDTYAHRRKKNFDFRGEE